MCRQDCPLDLDSQEVCLDPQERKRINLRVHPQHCGILKVTGVRWKLFDEVNQTVELGCIVVSVGLDLICFLTYVSLQIWGSMSFETPGPLLQDTLEKRASRARGPNIRLTSRIVPELPLLEAELEGVPETLFQV